MNPDEGELRGAIVLACQCQNVARIQVGRQRVQEMERKFVIGKIEEIAKGCLNLSDYWEYRRLLELCELLDRNLTDRIAAWGSRSVDSDTLEAYLDFTSKHS